jgi:hypothetical protein
MRRLSPRGSHARAVGAHFDATAGKPASDDQRAAGPDGGIASSTRARSHCCALERSLRMCQSIPICSRGSANGSGRVTSRSAQPVASTN